MSKERHHIDEYFSELNNLEFTAPEDSWKNIESQLDKKRRGGLLTIWTGLAAGLALLIGVGGYLKYISQDHQPSYSQHPVATIFQPNKPITNKKQPSSNLASKNTITDKTSDPGRGIGNSEIDGVNKTSTLNHLDNIHHENKLIPTENFETNKSSVFSANSQDVNKTDAISGPMAANHRSAENKSGYLLPMGIDLKTSAQSGLAVQKENVAATSLFTEPALIFPADEDLPKSKKVSHWSILGQVAPLYSYRKSEQPSEPVQGEEKGLMAYAGGFKVDYRTNRRFSIQAGVFYSVMGQRLDNLTPSNHASAYQSNLNAQSINVVYPTGNSMGPIVNKSRGSSLYADPMFANTGTEFNKAGGSTNVTVTNMYASQNTTQTASIIQELRFIEVPVLARYKIIDRKIGLHVLGGLSTNFLVNNNATLRQGSTVINNDLETGEINNMNYSGTIGLGINYEFLRRFDFSIEPTYKYYLNSISSNSQYTYRPYSFGIYTGIVYKFR